MTAPVFCSFLYASRNPHASTVQPGVSALGKKNITTVLPAKSLRDTSFPFSSGKVNSGALSLICMRHSPDQNLYRPTLYRRLAEGIIFAGFFIAQFSTGQIARKAPADKGPRALALLEVAANGKAHIVPITIMYDGKFYDAGAYKASPVPMALESDTVYEGLKTGTPQGLFTVEGARRVSDDWIGEGKWEAAGSTPQKKPAAPAKPPEENRDRPPVLRHAGQGNPKPTESSRPPKEPSPPLSPPPQTSTPPTSEQDDKDRPVLTRRKPQSETKQSSSTKVEAPAPDTKSSSSKVQVMLGISDDDGPEPRPYTFQMKSDEEQKFRKKMLALAVDEVRARDRQQAEKTSGPSGATPFAKGTGKVPEPIFDDVQLRVFDLTNANEPVLVLIANARMPNRDLRYYVALVGHEDVYGEVHKAFANVTDNRHLDIVPRLELLDAVDADGDGRGELLFRRVSDGGGGYDLYRVIGDKLYALYQSTMP
jgi:hypothetical protein